jgi:hypothetical protein
LKLEHDDFRPKLLEQCGLLMRPRLARADRVAAIQAADVRPAHPRNEYRNRKDNADEHREGDIDRDGQKCTDRDRRQIEHHQSAMARAGRADAANEIDRPRIAEPARRRRRDRPPGCRAVSTVAVPQSSSSCVLFPPWRRWPGVRAITILNCGCCTGWRRAGLRSGGLPVRIAASRRAGSQTTGKRIGEPGLG